MAKSVAKKKAKKAKKAKKPSDEGKDKTHVAAMDISDVNIAEVDMDRVREWKSPAQLDISDVRKWESAPELTPGQRASLEIARTVLWIFAGIYLFCFGLALYMITLPGSSYDKSVDLIKFLVGSILPLVTLAVGYYLGDRNSERDT